MGVSSEIQLPDRVRIRDVARLIGIYHGLEKVKSGSGSHWSCEVPGVSVEAIPDIPEMARIRWSDSFVHYHFEHHLPGRVLSPPSTPLWVAIGIRLVEFYGGSVIYQDCADESGYRKPWRDDCQGEMDEEEYQVFESRIYQETLVSDSELAKARKLAAYSCSE